MNVLRVIKTKKFWSYCLAVALLAVVFVLGLFIGNGTIHFKRANPTGLPATLNFSSVNEVYQTLRQNYDGKLTANQILDGIKHGIANATGDPYTQYFTPSEAKAFSGELDGTFSGIGAELSQDKNQNLIVMAPLDGSPAAQAGLRAQDVISSINGQSTSGMSLSTAVSKIRGPKGTKVTLGIIRGSSQQLSITITRNDIQIPTVTWKVLNGNIGYMQISQFSGTDTSTLAQKAAAEFKKDHVKGVILDLRNNPGGEVDAAVDVSSLWLAPNTLIMQERRGTSVLESYDSTGNNPLAGIPVAVLINSGSASAAEITALALHDDTHATLVGTKSFGKGIVQQVIPFADGSELKVTIAKWYSPNGQNINHTGITPDKAVQMTENDYKQGLDPQKQAALQLLSAH